jgi:hypothetical protein
MKNVCKLEYIKGDITKIDSVDAIVNAANNSLLDTVIKDKDLKNINLTSN